MGIARGLGSVNTNITACVTDGNKTVDTFRQSFIAFENREIFLGEGVDFVFVHEAAHFS